MEESLTMQTKERPCGLRKGDKSEAGAVLNRLTKKYKLARVNLSNNYTNNNINSMKIAS